jgi:hypothetical protein
MLLLPTQSNRIGVHRVQLSQGVSIFVTELEANINQNLEPSPNRVLGLNWFLTHKAKPYPTTNIQKWVDIFPPLNKSIVKAPLIAGQD